MKTLFLFLLTMGVATMTYSQPCPPLSETAGCDKFDIIEIFDVPTPECQMEVHFREYRCPDGSISIEIVDILWSHGICNGMRELNVFHWSLSTFDEFVTMLIIEQLWQNLPSDPCDGEPLQIRFYKANCGIWVGCKYTIDPETRACDPGYEPPYPDFTENNIPKVKAYKWQPCGETCCKRTYEVCVENGHLTAKYLGAEPLWADCTGQAVYSPRRCLTGCE